MAAVPLEQDDICAFVGIDSYCWMILKAFSRVLLSDICDCSKNSTFWQGVFAFRSISIDVGVLPGFNSLLNSLVDVGSLGMAHFELALAKKVGWVGWQSPSWGDKSYQIASKLLPAIWTDFLHLIIADPQNDYIDGFCEESDVCKLYSSLDDMQLAVYAMFGRCIQRCLRKPSISSMCMTALLELRDLLCAGG